MLITPVQRIQAGVMLGFWRDDTAMLVSNPIPSLYKKALASVS